MQDLVKFATILGAGAVITCAAPALAMEDTFVFMPGVDVGTPTGALPPAGLYLTTGVQYFNIFPRNASGNTFGVGLHDYNASAQLMLAPQMPEILGATYAAYVILPARGLTTTTPGGVLNAVGLENTVLSPINLSWDLHNNFHVSAGFSVYLPDGTYSASAASNVSRNYASFEPNASVSYLDGTWSATIHALFDFNTTNDANQYHSGDTITLDYSLLHKFGAFNLGFGGSYVQQFTNDTIDVVPVAASANNGYGQRGALFDIGPIVQYEFGHVTLSASVLFDAYAVNTAGGVRSFFSVSTPIWTPEPQQLVAAKY